MKPFEIYELQQSATKPNGLYEVQKIEILNF